MLFREGDQGRELYIVTSGKVATALRLSDGKERVIKEFTAGDFFGEMSIYENTPRSATCYTKTKSTFYTLLAEDFFHLIGSRPFIAIKIMFRMLNVTTQRLRDTSEFISDMVMWGERATKRAITDDLTGVYNRRFLDDALEDHFETAKNSDKPLSLVMVDLDYFRAINETYSNKVGDQVLREVTDVFRRNLRSTDIIARYGGDEFTFILPDTGRDKARRIAQKIRRGVELLKTLEKVGVNGGSVTTSQGIACYPENAEELKILRNKADQALYEAKRRGRNRVECAR
jgi:diguanylate cyclase (GGDEF)-like protein